jgi:hypothetical protein
MQESAVDLFSAFLGALRGELFIAEDAEKRREYRKRAPQIRAHTQE